MKILFPLFQTHYHQITITKTKEIKFEPRIKLNHNIYSVDGRMTSKCGKNKEDQNTSFPLLIGQTLI